MSSPQTSRALLPQDGSMTPSQLHKQNPRPEQSSIKGSTFQQSVRTAQWAVLLRGLELPWVRTRIHYGHSRTELENMVCSQAPWIEHLSSSLSLWYPALWSGREREIKIREPTSRNYIQIQWGKCPELCLSHCLKGHLIIGGWTWDRVTRLASQCSALFLLSFGARPLGPITTLTHVALSKCSPTLGLFPHLYKLDCYPTLQD